MTEIKGYENYTIDRDGKIWSKKSDIFLKPLVANKGYLMVGLYKNGKKKTFGIYHLLALAFIPNPENKLEVDHIYLIIKKNLCLNIIGFKKEVILLT